MWTYNKEGEGFMIVPHCWHSTGVTLTSNPPQYPEYCCHCDAECNKIIHPIWGDGGHGKFLRNQVIMGSRIERRGNYSEECSRAYQEVQLDECTIP